MIVPGARDEVIDDGRAITVTVASPHVPGSRHYRLMLRNRAVREALRRFRPDLIECQDAYNLPWAAIGHRKRSPETALVAAYMTDFPTVYVERPLTKVFGSTNPINLVKATIRGLLMLRTREEVARLRGVTL